MNVAMYLRKSRADENNPLETLERHKEILLSYAKDNNLTVIDIFEEVISGGMLYNRTEMLKLLDAIPSHIYDAVLCIDLDRLGRGSAADSEKIFDVLKENDVKIITLKKIYDLNNEYDEDYSEFEMFMARKELKFITRRMNRGRIKSINDGCFVSGAPFGYRNAVINKKHTLEVYEPEAKYVRMIFDMYVNQSMGITSISRQLANLGVLSKKNTPLHPTTIARMLRNHTYIGKIVWNKSKSVKGKNTQEKTSKDDWLYVPGLHEPIIDENTFNKAQDIINLKYKPPMRTGTLQNPFAGMLYNRTEMLKLLDAIPSHIYDAVLCIDLDRLGRGSAADSEKIFDVLKENDVKIITLKKIYDLNNEYDEDYSEFEMFMARKELKFITRRMNRGRIKSINDGCFVSGAPFGYRNAVINKKHTLEVYEPEAKYVRMIFDMYVNQSMGITSISRQLANLGVLSKKNTPLHPTTIARMLRNHTYIGKIVWNKSKSVKGKNTQEKTSKDDWLYVPGLHEPIIDENTFNKAQDIINLKYKPPMRTGTLQNPFAGLLKCANCGRAIVINTSNETVEKYRLCCRTLGCNKASALSIVEDKVFEVLTKEFKDIELSLKNIRQSHNKDKLSCLDTIATLETELKKLDKQQLRLYDLLEQEVYTKELFLERNNAISDRRKKINATIAQEREKFKLVDTSSIEERLPLLRELLTNYNSLSAAEKNSILKNFVKKIEYKREKSAPEGDIFLKIYYK